MVALAKKPFPDRSDLSATQRLIAPNPQTDCLIRFLSISFLLFLHVVLILSLTMGCNQSHHLTPLDCKQTSHRVPHWLWVTRNAGIPLNLMWVRMTHIPCGIAIWGVSGSAHSPEDLECGNWQAWPSWPVSIHWPMAIFGSKASKMVTKMSQGCI